MCLVKRVDESYDAGKDKGAGSHLVESDPSVPGPSGPSDHPVLHQTISTKKNVNSRSQNSIKTYIEVDLLRHSYSSSRPRAGTTRVSGRHELHRNNLSEPEANTGMGGKERCGAESRAGVMAEKLPGSASFVHVEVGAVDEGTAGKLAAVVAMVSCASSFSRSDR